MSPKITDEMRSALNEHPGQPVKVEDDQTQKVYFLIAADNRQVFDDWLSRELQIGFDEADRGEVAEWNVEQFLANAHERHQAESTQ